MAPKMCVPRQTVYDHYLDFCNNSEKPAAGITLFGRVIQALMYDLCLILTFNFDTPSFANRSCRRNFLGLLCDAWEAGESPGECYKFSPVFWHTFDLSDFTGISTWGSISWRPVPSMLL